MGGEVGFLPFLSGGRWALFSFILVPFCSRYIVHFLLEFVLHSLSGCAGFCYLFGLVSLFGLAWCLPFGAITRGRGGSLGWAGTSIGIRAWHPGVLPILAGGMGALFRYLLSVSN